MKNILILISVVVALVACQKNDDKYQYANPPYRNAELYIYLVDSEGNFVRSDKYKPSIEMRLSVVDVDGSDKSLVYSQAKIDVIKQKFEEKDVEFFKYNNPYGIFHMSIYGCESTGTSGEYYDAFAKIGLIYPCAPFSVDVKPPQEDVTTGETVYQIKLWWNDNEYDLLETTFAKDEYGLKYVKLFRVNGKIEYTYTKGDANLPVKYYKVVA